MDIEIGEYVRTKRGIIAKVADVDEMYIYADTKLDYADNLVCDYTLRENIKNHNKNIIELVEKGDYVNGQLVIVTKDIINDNWEKAILTENYDEWTDNGIVTNKDIKTILTKEKYAQNCYKVEV